MGMGTNMFTNSTSARALVVSLAMLGLGAGVVACGDDVDNGVADPPTAADPADPVDPAGGVDGFDESTIVGLPVDEARKVGEADGRDCRVAVIDGEDQTLTADFVEGRVNVAVSDGVVEGVGFIG
ncbi:hypothetical protein BH23ACT3_BH23ACT3_11550 [soil metagenome]